MGTAASAPEGRGAPTVAELTSSPTATILDRVGNEEQRIRDAIKFLVSLKSKESIDHEDIVGINENISLLRERLSSIVPITQEILH